MNSARNLDDTPKARMRGSYAPGTSRGKGTYHQLPLVDTGVILPSSVATLTLEEYWDEFYARHPEKEDHRAA